MEMIKETAKVVRQQQIDEGIFDMELSFPKGAALAKPGQFIAMYCNDKSKLLPRPISICGINPTEGTLRVVYRVAGEGTKEFSEMKAGDTLEVMGPLGNGFTMNNEKAIIIGGGIGIPPMLELAKQLDAEKTVVITGCSHPGIMNIIYTIQKRSKKKICGIVGGTHLVEADESRLKKTIAALKEINIEFIAVSHCTGDENLEIIKNAFGKKFIFNCTGNVIKIL